MGAGGTRVSNKQAVATTNLAANAVTTAKISALTVIGADISAGAVILNKLGTASVGNVALSTAAVKPAKISAGAVKAVAISALTIPGSKLSAGSIILNKLGTASVGNVALSAAAVKPAAISAGAVKNAAISALTITGAKLSAGAIIATKIGAAAVKPAAISANYATFAIPFMYSGTASGAATTRKILHYFSSPATVVGLWVAHSGVAAGPTAPIKVDMHVVRAYGSAAASGNSIFRSGAKATSVATNYVPGFTRASNVTTPITGTAGGLLFMDIDAHGSAVGTTKKWGAVILKQRLGY